MIQHRSLHQRSTRPARLAAITLCCLAITSTADAATAASDASRIEVGADQTATVSGDFASLKNLLDELCREAHVELRSYDADDRAVRVDYSGLPLSTLLARVLRQESYIVGVTPGDASQSPRVVWLRVTGGPPGIPIAPNEDAPSPPPIALEVPATFGEASFASEDPEQRARALEAVAKRLLAGASDGRGLLAAKPEQIAGVLRSYPHASALLRQLRDEQGDPATRAKLDAIIAALE